jgi:hypothetical protein
MTEGRWFLVCRVLVGLVVLHQCGMFDVTPQKGNKPASLVLTLVALAMTPVHSIVAAMSRADAAVFVALDIGCSLFFYAWNPSLARGNSKVPTRTLVKGRSSSLRGSNGGRVGYSG